MGKALTQVKDFLNYLGANADDHGRTHVSLSAQHGTHVTRNVYSPGLQC